MSDLATMLARIADELGDTSHLTTQIRRAVLDAIDRYAPDRFWFNESRAVTFTTVASTQDYTALTGDVSHIRDVYDIDYVTITIGNNVNTLDYIEPLHYELDANDASWMGQPHSYTLYDNKFRLLPVPNDAWTVRIVGHVKRAAPAADDETDNVWMVEAERLIRARAKYNLALDVLMDNNLAQVMAAATTEAFDQLKGRTNVYVGTGMIASSECF